MNRDFVVKPEFFNPPIGTRSIAMHFGPDFDSFHDEGLEALLVSTFQPLYSDTPKSFGQYLHCNRNHCFGRITLSPFVKGCRMPARAGAQGLWDTF